MALTNIGLKTAMPHTPNNLGWEGAMFRSTPDHTNNMMSRQFDCQSVEKSINQYPAFILSDDKLLQQNKDCYKWHTDHGLLVVNNDPAGCGDELFNVRNLNDSGVLQAGYARNIDLDSELKRINHIDDKCFYDTYKRHPYGPETEASAPNGLYCHRRALINNYSSVDPYIGGLGSEDTRLPKYWFAREGHEKQRPVFNGRYHNIDEPGKCFNMKNAPTAKWEKAYGTKNNGDASGLYLVGNPQMESGGETIFNNVTQRRVMAGPHGYARSMPC